MNEMNEVKESKDARYESRIKRRDYLSFYTFDGVQGLLSEGLRWRRGEGGRDPRVLHQIFLAQVSRTVRERRWANSIFYAYLDMACLEEGSFDYTDDPGMLFLIGELIERAHPHAKELGFAPPLIEAFFSAFRRLLDLLDASTATGSAKQDSTESLRAETGEVQTRRNELPINQAEGESSERVRALLCGAVGLLHLFLRAQISAPDPTVRRLYRGYIGEVYLHPAFSRISAVSEVESTRFLLVRGIVEEIAAASRSEDGKKVSERVVDLLLAVALIASQVMHHDYDAAQQEADTEKKELFTAFQHSLVDLFELVVEAGTQCRSYFREEIETVFEEAVGPEGDHNYPSNIQQSIHTGALHWLFRDWLSYAPLNQESARRLLTGAEKLLHSDVSAQADFELLEGLIDYLELYKSVNHHLTNEMCASIKKMLTWYATWAVPFFDLEAEHFLRRGERLF